MKSKLEMVLIGTSFLIPANAEAQRRAPLDTSPSRHYVAPASARLTGCRAPVGGRSYVCRPDARSRVVYRYSGRARRPLLHRRGAREWGLIEMYPVRHRGRSGTIGQGALRHMLGAHTFHRLREIGIRAGLRGPLRGTWFESRRLGAVLTVTMGGHEVAQLHDFDRDGLADDVWHRELGWR